MFQSSQHFTDNIDGNIVHNKQCAHSLLANLSIHLHPLSSLPSPLQALLDSITAGNSLSALTDDDDFTIELLRCFDTLLCVFEAESFLVHPMRGISPHFPFLLPFSPFSPLSLTSPLTSLLSLLRSFFGANH